jgi:hypothetical protein
MSSVLFTGSSVNALNDVFRRALRGGRPPTAAGGLSSLMAAETRFELAPRMLQVSGEADLRRTRSIP